MRSNPPQLYAPGERKGNRFYIARGRINGRQREINTRTTNKRHARAAWDRFVEHELAQGSEPVPASGSLAELIDAYVTARQPSKADRAFLDKLADSWLGQMVAADIRQAHVERAARDLYPRAANSTLNRQVVTPVAYVIRWAAESDLVPHRPFKRFKEADPGNKTPKAGTLDLLIANTEGRQRLLLLWLKHTGWRISESLLVEWHHLDLQAGRVDAWIPKAQKWKKLWLDDAIVAELANAEGPHEGPVFPWASRHSVYGWLRRLRKRLGVQFTPHMARHAFGSEIRDATDLVAVGTWTSKQSTLRYVETDEERARQVLRRRRA